MDIFISLGYPGFRKQRSICMNKIYKLVWSKVRNTWVVTSEIAKGHGKESSSGRNGKRLKLAVMTAILGGCFMTAGISPVAAELTKDQKAVYDAVMTQLKASGKVELGVARGDDSETDAEATAEGANANVSAGDKVTLKAGRGIKLKQDGTNVQIGLKFIDMNPAGYPFNDAKATGAGALAVGQNSIAKAQQATAVGLDTEADQYGVALGTTSKAGSGAVAIGSRAFANGDDSIAIGGGKRNVEKDPTKGYRKIDSNYAIAIGKSAAIGEKSEASSAVGYYAEIAQSEWSSAFGGYSKIENSKYASTLGAASKVENAAFGTALGGYSEVQGSEYGTSLGTSSRVQRSDYGTALGSNAAVIGAEGGVAIGAYSVADRSKGSMMGYNPAGDQWNNVKDYLEKTGQTDAFNQAIAKVQAAYQAWQEDPKNPELRANFYQARAEQSKMISTWTGLQGAVSIGDEREGLTRQLTGLAAGTKDTDAVNVAQLKALNTKVDQGAIHYFSVNSDDKNTPDGTNWKNDGATGKDAIAIGKKAVSEGDGSIAIGRGSKVFNTNQDLGMAIGAEAESSFGSIVIGKNARDYDTDPKKGAFGVYIGREAKSLGGSSQTVIGNYGQAKGEDSTAIGTRAQALGGESLAVGSSAKSLGQGAASFGTDSIAEFDESTALGTYSNGRGNRSVASGNKSVAAGHNSVAIGYQTFAHNGFIDGDAYKALSPEEQKKYFKASGFNAYFLKDTADGNDAKKIGDTYLNTAVGSYSKAYKHATTLGGMTSAKEEGTAVGTYAKAYKKGAASFGYRAQSNAENGVALGAYSFADREKGKIGYVLGGDNSTLEKALESIGQKAKYDELTGKINPLKNEYNGLLKAYVDAPAKSAEKKKAQENLDAWKAAHPDFLPAVKERQQMIAAWQSGNGAVSVGTADASRQITNVAAGSEDTDAVNVAQLKALNTKVDQGAIHYYSVTSDKKAAGSNFDNDGAKAADSMVIGIGSSSEAPNSTVLGNNNTLKRYNADQNGSSSRNNIVAGQNMEVEGAHNAVFGTDYQNNLENRKTMVAGKHNTVIGVGNLAGYTAEKDPQNRFKWIYSKVENGSDSGNVVVGMNNTATRGSLVIGSESEATSSGISVGNHNKVVSDEDFGVALGSDLVVDGYQALAIGSKSEAKADYTVAIGGGALAEKENSIAFGNEAKAQNNYSVAFGSFATATARSGVALGSSSLANREKGALGYLAEANTTSEAWKATRGAISIGNSDKKYTRQLTGLAAGTEDTDAVNVAQLKAVNAKVDQNKTDITEINKKITNLGESSGWTLAVARGDDSKTDSEATAEGTSTKVSGGTVTLKAGRGVKLKQDGTNVQIGLKFIDMDPAGYPFNDAKASGGGSLAVGQNSVAKAHQATAVGLDTEADEYGVALGTTSKAGKSAVAIGSRAFADGTDSIAIGEGKRKVENDPTQGYRKVDSDYAIAIGASAAIGEKSDASSAVGYYAEIAQSEWSNAFGGYSKIENSNYASTFGTSSKVKNAAYGTALGNLSRVENAAFGTALGNNAAVIDAQGGVAIGAHSVANRNALMPGYNPTGEQWSNFQDYLEKTGQKDAYDQATAKLEAAKQAWAADKDNPELRAKVGQAIAEQNKIVNVWAGTQGAVSIGNEQMGFTRQLTGVAAGTQDTDAVNVAQLKVVNEKADKNATDITNLTKTVNANGKATIVKVDGKEESTDGNLKIKKTEKDGQLTYDLSLNDNITIGKDGKDGKIGINGKDGKSADITVGKGEAGVDGKDGITRIIYKDQDKNTHEVATLDDGLKFKGDNDAVVIRKLNTQLNITGGAAAADLSDDNIGVVGKAGDQGGMTVKLSKKLKGLTSAEFVDGDNITNISAGNVTITRKDGKVDLWELNKTVNNITQGTTDVSSWKLQANGANERTIKKDSIVNFKNGQNTEVTVNGNDITVDLNAATKKQINDNTTNITNMKKDIKDIQTTVNNIDTKIEQKIEGSKIKVEGDAKTGVKAEAVKTGDKVTGYKVSLDKKVQVGNVTIDGTGEGTDSKGEITGLTNKDWDGENIVSGRAATEDQLKAAMGKVQAQSRTTVKGSTNITVKPDTKGASEYTVELAKDITVDSVTAKTVKADEYKVGDKTYINDKGIDANGNKITNVADGVVSKDSKDAVNGSQLFATNQMVVNNMNQINNLREESREGDALGAAMAALKPLDFDPYQRSQVMAGVGYYRGKEAVALGLAHYKNEDLMIHGGLAYAGNSELMANVGVSYRFGSKDDRDIKHDRNLRMPQYAEGPISSVYILQDEVDRLTKENKEANDRIAALEAKLEKVLEKVK